VVPFVFHPASAVSVAVYELRRRRRDRIGRRVSGRPRPTPHRAAGIRLYPIATFGLALVAFAAAGSAHASGFIAAYLAAVVLANSGCRIGRRPGRFAEGVGWLAQIGLFVLLGLLVNPANWRVTWSRRFVVGLVLLLVARPLSVVGSLVWFRVRWREQVFLSWAGLRGAVPIVLATFPVVAGVARQPSPAQHRVHAGGGIHVGAGPQPSPIAHWLGLISREATREDPSRGRATGHARRGTADHDRARRRPSCTNVTILELRLPDPAVITLIIRDGHTFVPIPDTPYRDRRRIADRHHQQDTGRGRIQASCRQ